VNAEVKLEGGNVEDNSELSKAEYSNKERPTGGQGEAAHATCSDGRIK
jgi:hypothetical protein